MKSTMTSFAQK